MFRKSLWAGAAAALALAASAAPAPAATLFGWSSPAYLSAAGQPAWTPDVAYAGNGSAVFAWGRYDGSQYVAQAVQRAADGTLGPVLTVSDRATMALLGPRVAADDAGNALLAWTRWDGSYWRVQARTLSASGVLGSVETLSSSGQHASNPRLAVNGAGAGVVTWTRSDGDDLRVEARTMSTAGDVGDLKLVSDDNQDARDVDVGIDSDGDASLVWARSDPAEDLIVTNTLEADGTVDAQRTLSNSNGFAESPRVAVNEAGDVAFSWTRSGSSGDRAHGRIDPAAGPLGPVQTLSAAGESASDARVGIDATGDAEFAWTRWDGSDWRVQSVLLPAGGTPGPVQTLSDAGESAGDPEVAMATGGTAAVTWRRWNGSVERVQVARLSASGTSLGVSTRSDAGNDADTPQVAVHSDKVLVAWEGTDNRIQFSSGAPYVVIGNTVPTIP